MEKLTQLIDDIVEQKTFSMDGIEGVKRIRDRAATLESQATEDKKLRQKDTETIRELRAESIRFTECIAKWNKRESELQEREAKMIGLEKGAAVSEAKADTFKKCFGFVFRNTETVAETKT